MAAKLHLAYLLPYLTVLFFGVRWFGVIGAALAWSARSFWDPMLFVMTGTMRRVLPIILPGMAIVGAAVAVGLNLRSHSLTHWIAILFLLILAAGLAVRIDPGTTSGERDLGLARLLARFRGDAYPSPTSVDSK